MFALFGEQTIFFYSVNRLQCDALNCSGGDQEPYFLSVESHVDGGPRFRLTLA
jgi:hypothetical protein